MLAAVKGRALSKADTIGSLEELTSSNSIVRGQYLIGKYLGWLSNPESGLNRTVCD